MFTDEVAEVAYIIEVTVDSEFTEVVEVTEVAELAYFSEVTDDTEVTEDTEVIEVAEVDENNRLEII